ncbi:hypothetical protein TNCV_4275521 [Trichonephila clavipes]|nr:hypothetical protein TNCV_4275521 [Trichonephila clavipes]
MTQPLGYHCPDNSKQGFIDLPEFPFENVSYILLTGLFIIFRHDHPVIQTFVKSVHKLLYPTVIEGCPCCRNHISLSLSLISSSSWNDFPQDDDQAHGLLSPFSEEGHRDHR